MLAHAMVIFVTGAAGFIGSHLCERLCARGDDVIGLDNFDAFYARADKEKNLAKLRTEARFTFVEGDIRDADVLDRVFAERHPEAVVHLAALAGVRPSLAEPARWSLCWAAAGVMFGPCSLLFLADDFSGSEMWPLGMEVAGRIVALGVASDLGPPQSANGRRWSIGDEVCALVSGGGYAERTVAPCQAEAASRSAMRGSRFMMGSRAGKCTARW
jgi:NAD(P)-dependent dehydrogenase (short-subunit alcohol dehydrogenase family)